jgi:hypothetical protein
MKTCVEYLPVGNGGGPAEEHAGSGVTDSPVGGRHMVYLVRTVTGNRLAPGSRSIEGGHAISVPLA